MPGRRLGHETDVLFDPGDGDGGIAPLGTAGDAAAPGSCRIRFAAGSQAEPVPEEVDDDLDVVVVVVGGGGAVERRIVEVPAGGQLRPEQPSKSAQTGSRCRAPTAGLALLAPSRRIVSGGRRTAGARMSAGESGRCVVT